MFAFKIKIIIFLLSSILLTRSIDDSFNQNKNSYKLKSNFSDMCIEEKTFNKLYYKQLQKGTIAEMFKNNIESIENSYLGLLVRTKWGEKIISLQKLKINQKIVKREEIFQHFHLSIKLKNKKFSTKFILCVMNENYVYLFFEDIYCSLNPSNIHYEEFFKKRDFQKRLLNYHQIANSLLDLHKTGYAMTSFSSKNILSKDENFSSLRLFDFSRVLYLDEKFKFNYNFLNAPEMNYNRAREVDTKMDMFSLGLTIGLIEINQSDFITKHDWKFLKENYKKSVFCAIKNELIEELSKKLGRSNKRASKFVQFFRWLKEFFVYTPKIDYCVDFVCLVETAISYNPEERPSVKEFLNKLNFLIYNYNADDMFFPEISDKKLI